MALSFDRDTEATPLYQEEQEESEGEDEGDSLIPQTPESSQPSNRVCFFSFSFRFFLFVLSFFLIFFFR